MADITVVISYILLFLFLGLITLLVFPFPMSLKKKISRFFARLIIPILGSIAILFYCICNEFIEQRKYGKRRLLAADGESGSSNLQFFASEYFRHQRNMYISIISGVAGCVVVILVKLVSTFIKENDVLTEQVNVRRRAPTNEPQR